VKTLEDLDILSADRPLVDPRNDSLGYASLAEHLADSICKMSPPEGLVIAIYGPWGSGKTTLLNFVVHYLHQKPEDTRPIVVRFNPWWFSGYEDLTRRFFDQLQAVLNRKEYENEKVRKRIADFAEAISEIPYLEAAKLVAMTKPGQRDATELKDKLTNVLKEQKKRILIIIDDIDRLIAEEIRQLFRVIKAVADFPNTVYLLAFDKKVVRKALNTQNISGEAYLNKIVQVPFELPLPDEISLRQLFFERLSSILTSPPSELFDQTDWGNAYWKGIRHFIATPRDVARLTNALSVTYPVVRGEVNVVDFVVIETLRVFYPPIYDTIRRNPALFADDPNATVMNGSKIERPQTFYDSLIDQVQEEHKNAVKQLLMYLFPRLRAVWGGPYYSASYLPKWRKQLRVCSLTIFPIYFRLTTPKGDISNAEMRALLSVAANAEAFGARLVELAEQRRPNGTTRVRAFLERLVDYIEQEIPVDDISSVVQALFNVGDRLLKDEPRGPFDLENDTLVLPVIVWLLRRLGEPARFDVLKKSILEGQSISTIVHSIEYLGQEHGKYEAKQVTPEEERLVSSEHLEELEEFAFEKLQDTVQHDSLLEALRLPAILYWWRDRAGEEEVRQWVQKAVEGDEGLAAFLERFLQRGRIGSLSDAVAKIYYKLDLQQLELFIEPSQIIDRVSSLAQSKSLSEDQRVAVEQFIQGYETRQQGKNSDNLLT
jgi:predicted KAP-like P-loop ATPase